MKPSLTQRLQTTASLLRKRQTIALFLGCALAAGVVLLAAAIVFSFIPVREATAFSVMVAVVLAAIVTAVALAVWTWMRPISLSRLAVALEKHHPEWMDGLICAVELEQKPAAERRVLEQALVEKTNRESAETNFTAILLPRFWQKRMLGAGAIVLLLLLIPLFFTSFFAKGRFFLADLTRGTSTGLIVTPGNGEAPIHSDVRVKAQVLRWENNPTIEYSDEQGRHSFPMNQEEEGHSFTFYDLSQPVSYRVSTSSLRSPWFEITPYVPPSIEETEILIQPPAYTRLPPQTLTELGNLTTVAGSQIQWRIRSASAETATLEADSKPFAMERRENGDFFHALTATQSFTGRIRIEDREGHAARTPPFAVTVTPDNPPTIDVTRPGEDTEATPDALVSLRALAADDFGLTQVVLHVSISGEREPSKEVFTADPAEAEPTLEEQIDGGLNLESLETKEGDVITYFFTATDNRAPNPQQSRSEIYFIEVREEVIPEEMDGEPMELERIDLQALILELKRLIRLSWETLSRDDLATEREIASGLGEVHLETGRIQQEVLDQVGEEEGAALVALLGQAMLQMQDAAAELAGRRVEPSIPFQEKALGDLVAIQTQLMKNQAQSKKPSDSSSSGPSSPPPDDVSAEEQLEALQELQRQVQQMADKQGSQSSALRRMSSMNADQQTEMQNRQEALQEQAEQTANALAGASELESVRRDLTSAAQSMEQSAGQISENRASDAARDGDRARSSLLSALERIEDAIGQATGNQISDLASQAQQLAGQQGEAAGGSRGLAESDSPSREEASALREQQQSLQQDLEKLLAAMSDTSNQLRESNPDAARAVAEAGQQIRDQNVAGEMGRAGNALLYRQFDRAAEMQEGAAQELTDLAQSLDESSSLLPSMSRQQMEQLLSQLQRAQQEVLGMTGQAQSEIAERLEQLTDRLGEQVGQAGKSLNDPALQEISGELRGNAAEGAEAPNLFRTDSLLRAAARTLQQQLFTLEMERRARLQRQTSEPPEEYRGLVEEYFRSLSDSP